MIAAILNIAKGELGARDLTYACVRIAVMTVVLDIVLVMSLYGDGVHYGGAFGWMERGTSGA
jgi:hypothetical protein